MTESVDAREQEQIKRMKSLVFKSLIVENDVVRCGSMEHLTRYVISMSSDCKCFVFTL